jgi:hypothetical protein
MNEPSNAPMLPPSSGFSAWMTVWRDALTRPSDQTFARIGLSPNAKASTGLLWVFLGSLVNFFLASLVQGPMMRQMMQNSGLDPNALPAASGGLIAAICGAPIGALISTVLFALAIGIVQVIAKMFGGRGTFDQMIYAIAAIVAPFSIISGLLTLLSAIPVPFVGLCFGFLGLVGGLYVLALEVMAVKGVNQFGWGQAAASLLLPVFAIACCVAVFVGGMLTLSAPEMMDTFNSIMTPVP